MQHLTDAELHTRMAAYAAAYLAIPIGEPIPQALHDERAALRAEYWHRQDTRKPAWLRFA